MSFKELFEEEEFNATFGEISQFTSMMLNEIGRAHV